MKAKQIIALIAFGLTYAMLVIIVAIGSYILYGGKE